MNKKAYYILNNLWLLFSGFDMIGYIFLGSCITMAAILTATTLYYRRKLKTLTSASKARNNMSKPGGETDYNLRKKKASWQIFQSKMHFKQRLEFQVLTGAKKSLIHCPISVRKNHYSYLNETIPSLVGYCLVHNFVWVLFCFILHWRNPAARLDRILSRKFLYSEREDIS